MTFTIMCICVVALSTLSYSLASLRNHNLFTEPRLVAFADYSFAHEGPVYDASSNSLYFTSNIIDLDVKSKLVHINRMSMETYETTHNVAPSIPMANGATLSPWGTIVFCGQGNSTHDAGLYELDPKTLSVKMLLNDWRSLPFNSPNDVAFSGNYVWFTDPDYGYEQEFRPIPQVANYVWRATYDSITMQLSDPVPILDGFLKPNGILIVNDKIFVTDSGYQGGKSKLASGPRNVYIYDLEHGQPVRKRLFAVSDHGVPDGLRADADHRLYIGCGDGVHVYDISTGDLLEKIVVSGGVANLAIVGNKIVMLNEKNIWISERVN